MADMSTGKRKREARTSARDEEEDDAMAALKRHFETQFAPLKQHARAKGEGKGKGKGNGKKMAKADECEWAGIPDEEEEREAEAGPSPQVISFDALRDPLAATIKLPRSILKSFMSSKPPSAAATAPPASRKQSDDDRDEDPAAEASLLKNDLALQRLLRESHLLDAADTSLEATGRNRLKALESRVQALGGRDITVQRHSMLARRGMDAAKRGREEKRRKEAKEAGIVLEREVRVRKVSERERERERGGRGDGGFGPSVGRFRSGMLVLSKRDVMDIEGRTGSGGGGGGKGKGKGKGKVKGKGFKGGKGGGGKKRR